MTIGLYLRHIKKYVDIYHVPYCIDTRSWKIDIIRNSEFLQKKTIHNHTKDNIKDNIDDHINNHINSNINNNHNIIILPITILTIILIILHPDGNGP